MDEQGLQNLLALGFSYEDLYKKGLLVLKSTGEDQSADADQSEGDQIKIDEQPAAAPTQSAADPTQSEEYIKMWKAFDLFKAEIKQMIQGQNRENAFRDNPNDQAMTVSAAIEGLYKGGK